MIWIIFFLDITDYIWNMLSRWVTYLLLSMMLVYTFSQSVIVTDYLINIEYITKVFCVNKEKPQMKCNGKCHLAKELQKDEEKKSKNFEKSIEISLICETNNTKIVGEKIDLPLSQKDMFIYLEPLAFEFNSTIFHPPIFQFN